MALQKLSALERAKARPVTEARVRKLIADAGGGGGGSTDLTYDPVTRLLSSSTGADVLLPLAGLDPGLMSTADKTKLDGVAAGATVNASDASLRDRATHTGSQLAATISDFAAAVAALITGKQDTLVSATNIKTVNGNSLLGAGDLVVSGGGGASPAVSWVI